MADLLAQGAADLLSPLGPDQRRLGRRNALRYNTFYIPAFESLRRLADYDLWQRPFFNNVRYFFFYCLANHGIPKAYHREKANHWHVTAETGKSSGKTRIAAVMSVYGAKERFDVQLKRIDGWLGATAVSNYGQVEGWIRFDQTSASPPSPGAEDISPRVNLWGRSRDGETFRV